jgi:hypothetical protein
LVLYASGLLIGRRLSLDVTSVPAEVELTVLPPPCPVPVQPIDFGHTDFLIEQGYMQAARFLDEPELRTRIAA